MTRKYILIQETASRVIDPVSEQLTTSILDRLNILPFVKDNILIKNDRSASSQSGDGEGNINLMRNQVEIEIDTKYNPSEQFWPTNTDYNNFSAGVSQRYKYLYQPIFFDYQSNFLISEQTQPFGLSMTFNLTLLSYDVAQQILSIIMSQNVGTMVNHVHDIVYSYPLDMQALVWLWSVFKLKIDYPTKDSHSFLNYINQYSTAMVNFDVRRLDLFVPNKVPENQIVVKRQQLNCQALLTCDNQKPEPIMEEGMPRAYSLSFTYQIQFGRPHSLAIDVPPLIDNSPLPNTLFDTPPEQFLSIVQGYFQNAGFNSTMRYLQGGKYADKLLVRFPWYDSWVPPKGTLVGDRGYAAFFIGAISIVSGQTQSINLNDLGTVELGDFVKTIMSMHSADDIFGIDGLFNITFFSNGIPLDRSIINWDPTTLTASFTGTRIHNVYRIVISETKDIKQINPKWFQTLIKYRYYFPLTIVNNLKYLTSQGYYSITYNQNLINLINRLIRINALDSIINQMITGGYTTSYIYQFTQTSLQFADYISETQALTPPSTTPPPTYPSPSPPSIVVSTPQYSLFDIFVRLCVSNNYVSEGNAPTLYIMHPKGLPYGAGAGGFDRFTVPLRIFNVTITT